MSKSFWKDVLELVLLIAITHFSKDSKGKSDPYKAAGIAYGMKGKLTDKDLTDLGTMLGAQDAFDEEDPF